MKRHIRLWLNLWPPFLGSGIRVTRLDPDWRAIDVEMKLRFFNRNYVGTHYGGSLYSMTDPFYMLMLIENLGRDYVVWDKSASIRFRLGPRPCNGNVSPQRRTTGGHSATMQAAEKIEPTFTVEVKDESGEVVAVVDKVVQVRKKRAVSAGEAISSAVPGEI